MLCCVFLITASTDMIRPIVSYRALDLDASTAQIGILAPSLAALSMFISIPGVGGSTGSAKPG